MTAHGKKQLRGTGKLILNSDWARRRFYDFRNGHNTYLVFAMSFMQFVVVTYTLAVERLNLLEKVFPSMWMWAAFFVGAYVPAAILIGSFHLKKQIPIETKQITDNNPFTYRTTPSKEQLYSLPAARINYELMLKQMSIQNQLADAMYEIFNRPIEKWTREDFGKAAKMKEITERLERGENILDIVQDGKAYQRQA